MNEKALRRLVADEFRGVLDGPEPTDEQCRCSCSIVLKAIDDYLSQSVGTIPLIFLRETVSRIIQEIGPGDSLFRTRWRGILMNAKSVESLKFALEFVDCTIPPQSEDATAEVIKSLERMAQEHHDVLADIFHTLRKLAMCQKVRKKTVFQFIAGYLSKVPHSSIEDALYCLLDQASDNDDWSVAINCVRGEGMGGIKRNNNEIENGRPMGRLEPVFSAVIKFQQDQVHERFFEEYLFSLDNLCNPSRPDDEVDDARRLNEVDLVILLLHRLHKEHGTYVEQLLNNAVWNGDLDSRTLISLTRVLLNESDEDKSQRLRGLHVHLVWLLVFLCVGPLRTSKVRNVESVASLAVEFGSVLVELSGSARQQVVLSALLQVNDQCLHFFSQFDAQNVDCTEGKMTAMQRVQSVVVQLLMGGGGVMCSFVKSDTTTLVRTLSCSGVTTTTAAKLCRILISAGQVECLLALTRSMLFSHGDGSSKANDRSSSEERKIRGLILMTEMVKSKRCGPVQLSLLWQSLRHVLLNPMDRMIDPGIGIHGLKAVRAFHDWMQSGDNKSRFASHSEIFPTMTSILMNSRLVQYASATAKSLPEDPVKLGYSVRPEFVAFHGTKQRTYHKMIFSFGALLNDETLLSPDTWVFSSRWVHDLIDAYLTLGRTKSKGKWIPHAWVEAAFDFPFTDISCLRATNTRQQKMIEIVSLALHEHVAFSHTAMSMTSLDKDFGDALKQVKSPIERSKLVRGLLRISMSYCLALALCAGILGNTFAHYSGILESEGDNRDWERKEATRMMQYQLAKIYDLVGKGKMLECIFRGISTVSLRGKRRQKKRNRGQDPSSIFDNVKFDSTVQKVIDKFPPIISSFVSTDEYVGTKVLWNCLVDPSNDSLMIKKFEHEFKSSDSLEMDFASFDGIVDLRLNILNHLTTHLRSFSRRNWNTKPRHTPDGVRQELEWIQPIFAQSLRLASYLSMFLSSQDPAGVHAGRLSRIATLTGAYFRLLLLVMEINLEGCSDDAIKSCYMGYRGLYQSIMGSEQPLTDAIGIGVARPETFKSIMNPLLKHLSKCRHMLIASEFLETLSVFALYSNTRESIQEMVGISWAALHSHYPSSDEKVESSIITPRVLLESLRRLAPAVFVETSKLRALKDTAVRETILKSALRRPKTSDKVFFQLHGMVRLWGFLALAENFCPVCADHLHELYMNLLSFLCSMKDVKLVENKGQKDAASSGDDEYIPPKPKQAVVRLSLDESTVPGLGLKNHFTYFQILLDMAVSSSALFTVNDGSDWVDPLNGPYRELCKITETFGSLIDLYRKRIYTFPPQTLSVVLNACRSMLNVVVFQCTECIEWRSSQPAPTADQIEARTFDPAAVQYLGRVFDLFGVHVIGTLDSLCSFFIESTKGSELSSTNGMALAPRYQQQVKALRIKTGKISLELEKFAAAHKLPSPRKVISESESGQPSRKRRRIEIKGFLQFEESAEESEDTSQRATLSTAIPMNRTFMEHRTSNNDVYSSELTWDACSSDEDISFGADGDWGRESEEELETG